MSNATKEQQESKATPAPMPDDGTLAEKSARLLMTKDELTIEAANKRREFMRELQAGETRTYRCGLKEGTPFHYLTLGGFTFSHFTYSVNKTPDPAETTRDRVKGAIYRLTKGQYNNILKSADSKIIRVVSGIGKKGKKGNVRYACIAKDSLNFFSKAGDIPVRDLIYMERVEVVEAPEQSYDVNDLDKKDQVENWK